MEQGKGKGIVVSPNGGFPPPVSQRSRVNRPDKERHPGLKGRLERAGTGGLTPSTEQLIHQTVSSVSVIAFSGKKKYHSTQTDAVYYGNERLLKPLFVSFKRHLHVQHLLHNRATQFGSLCFLFSF